MAKTTVAYEIKIEAAGAQKTIGGLEKSIDKLKELRDGEDIGSKAFNDLSKAIQTAEGKVKNVELAFESLDVEQKLTAGTDAVVGLAGGFAAASGAMALMGIESEAMEETLTKVASALALSSGLRDLGNGVIAFRKLGGAAKVYAVIQKGVNAVMNANPIFIIVAAITAAIAALALLEGAWFGVSKAEQEAADVQEQYNAVQEASLENAAKEINALDNLIRAVKSETTSREDKNAAINKLQEDYPEYLGNITEEDILTGRLNGNIAKQTQLIQLRAEANAAATLQEEAQLKLLRTKLTLATEERNSQQDVAEAAKIAGLFGDKQAALDKVKAERHKEAMREANEEVAAINSVTDSINSKLAAIESEAVAEGGKIKTVSKAKTVAHKKEVEEIEEMQALKRATSLDTVNALTPEDAISRELAVEQEKFNRLAEMGRVYAQGEIDRIQAVKDAANAADADRQAGLDKAQQGIDLLGGLNDAFIKDEEKREKIRKALAIAQIAVDTARGISAAIAAGAGVPFPGNIPAIISGISAVVGGIVQAKAVLKDSSSTPSISSAAGGAGGGSNGANINQISNTATLVDQNQQNLTQQVVVLESDITGAVNNVAAVEDAATF